MFSNKYKIKYSTPSDYFNAINEENLIFESREKVELPDEKTTLSSCNKILDECRICGGGGPQFACESSGKSYCTEYQYQQKCKSD